MSIKRDESTEFTKKYALDNSETFELESNNYEQLLGAVEYYKEKIVASIITEILNNKKELSSQIEETLNHLKSEQDSLENKMREISEQEILEIDPNINQAFQERKHEHDMRILEKQKKVIEKKLERVNGLIKNFGDPSKFIETLIYTPIQEKGNELVWNCIQSLVYNAVNAGLKLYTRNSDENIIKLHLDNIESLVKIALSNDLIEELKELSNKVKEVELQNSTEKQEKELRSQEQKDKIAKKAEALASEYMENLLVLFESQDELVELEEKKELVGNPNLLHKIIGKFKHQEEQIDYDEEIEKLKSKIKTYLDVCEGKNAMTYKAYSSIRKHWKEFILRKNFQTKSNDELDILREYLYGEEDKEKAAKDLVENAEAFFSKAQDKANKKIIKLIDVIEEKENDKATKIEKLVNNSSQEIQEVWNNGVDLNRINDFYRLRNDFSTGADEHIVPAVALLVLYELLKEENIASIEQSRELGYEIPNIDELRKNMTEENRNIVSKLAEVERALKEIQNEQVDLVDDEGHNNQSESDGIEI